MNKTKYNQLREEIILAVPEIVINENAQLIKFNGKVKYFRQYRPISLEDCLIDIEKKHNTYPHIGIGSGHSEAMLRLLSVWQPNIPLQDQSDECKELLWDLICKK